MDRPNEESVQKASIEATVLAGMRPAKPEPRSDPDDALREAIKAALDAGDFERVRALVAVLESSPRPATVLALAPRKAPR